MLSNGRSGPPPAPLWTKPPKTNCLDVAFSGRRVVFSGPFRARLALTLTDAAARDRWDDEHREAVAADFLLGWDDLEEQSNGLRALVVTAVAPFPSPGVVVYIGKPLDDGETIEVRAVAHHSL